MFTGCQQYLQGSGKGKRQPGKREAREAGSTNSPRKREAREAGSKNSPGCKDEKQLKITKNYGFRKRLRSMIICRICATVLNIYI